MHNLKNDEVSVLPTQGLFLAIGHQPNTELFKGVIDLDKAGYIVPVEHTMTNIPGVFAAGDVTDHRYRQAVQRPVMVVAQPLIWNAGWRARAKILA